MVITMLRLPSLLAICAVLASVSSSRPSWARDAARPSRKQAHRTATLVVLPPTPAGELVEALEAAVRDRRELRFRPLSELLGDEEDESREAARRLLRKGRRELRELRIEAAVRILAAAVAGAEQRFDRFADDTGRALYVELVTALAIARLLAGDGSKASEQVYRAMTIDPALRYDRRRFPPQMKQVFTGVRELREALGRGGVKIRSSPSGAEALVDGQPAGVTPLRVSGLVEGRHLVSARLPGRRGRTTAVQVVSGKNEGVSIELPALPGGDPLGKLREALEGSGGTSEQRIDRAGRAAAAKLQVDLLLVLRSAAEGAELLAFDASRRRRAAAVRVRGHGGRDGQRLARLLVRQLDAPSPVERSQKSDRPGWLSRLVRSSYFWPVVGAVLGAAAIAVGTAVGIAANSGPDRGRQVVLLPALLGP